MANSVNDLDNLPDITLLEDLGITLEELKNQAIIDYQDDYEKTTGEEIVLYPGNRDRLLLNVMAGMVYQAMEISEYEFKQNFIQFMDEEVLKNWGANLGFHESNLKASTCTVEFSISNSLGFDVSIPAGSRVTAGDDVYFATDYDAVIPAGETAVNVSCTCTEEGSVGEGYAPGQIDMMADPLINVSGVRNVDFSSGGSDDFELDDLRERIYLFPSTYSTAGPEDAYIELAKEYDSNIVSVECITNKDTATVEMYVMLVDAVVPDNIYCERVKEHILHSGRIPDTDNLVVYPPDVVEYELHAKYYISEKNKDTEAIIRESVEDAAYTFSIQNSEQIGLDINPDIFIGYARVAGAKRVEISSPVYQPVGRSQIAICSSILLEYGGLEDD